MEREKGMKEKFKKWKKRKRSKERKGQDKKAWMNERKKEKMEENTK